MFAYIFTRHLLLTLRFFLNSDKIFPIIIQLDHILILVFCDLAKQTMFVNKFIDW